MSHLPSKLGYGAEKAFFFCGWGQLLPFRQALKFLAPVPLYLWYSCTLALAADCVEFQAMNDVTEQPHVPSCHTSPLS